MSKNTIENLIKKALKETKIIEAEVSAGPENTMFNLKVDVSNK